MATQQSDSPEPVDVPAPALSAAKGRSEALEVELAMLEAILPTERQGAAQPAGVDPPTEGGDTR
jgi:hypothetical protein